MKKASQKSKMLEDYGYAQSDAALLNIMLQQMSNSPDVPPGMDQTFVRSIERAELEMYQIKARYEEGE